MKSCTPSLASANGVTASIVDVGDLAGSTRRLEVTGAQGSAVNYPAVTIEMFDTKCQSIWMKDDLDGISKVTLEIPRRAVWMTVTSPSGWLGTWFGGVTLRWEMY